MQDGKNQLNSSKSGKNNNVACELSKVNTVTEKQRGGRSKGGGGGREDRKSSRSGKGGTASVGHD